MIDFEKIGELTPKMKEKALSLMPKLRKMAAVFCKKAEGNHYKDLLGEGFLGLCYGLFRHQDKSEADQEKTALNFARKAMAEYISQKVPIIRKPQYWPDKVKRGSAKHKPLEPIYVCSYDMSVPGIENRQTIINVLGARDTNLPCNTSDHILFTRKYLNKVLSQMEAEEQQVIILRLRDKMKYDKIVEITGLQKNRVTNIVRKFTTTMKKKFDREFGV